MTPLPNHEQTSSAGRRVCMIVMSLYPQDERVRREATALERAGIAVDVLCQRGPGQSSMERLGGVTAWRLTPQSAKESIGRYLLVSARFVLAAFFKLQRLSLGRRYDVIQAHNMPDYLLLAGLVHKLAGTPLVLDLHDLSVELFGAKWNGRHRRLLPLVAGVERLCCRLANRVITTSTGFGQRLAGRGVPPEKIELVLNAPDPRHFHFQSGRGFAPIDHGLRLFYHGTVAERFGLAEAIEATALLRERIPGTHLAIHGKYDPSYRRRLEEQVERRGLRDHVTLGGWLGVEEIPPAIAAADIGIVPYLKDDFMNLALSTKTFEYAATGLPVAASRLASIATHFDGRCVGYFEPGDPADMARRIAALARDPARRRSQTRHALAALEEVSGTVMEQRYLTLMKSLMGLGGHHD